MAVSDFLGNLSNPETLSNIAAAVMAGQANRSAGQGLQAAYAPNSYDAMYQQLSTQLQGLSGELADTNNPQFQARVAARTDEIMRQYEAALRQQQALEARRYGRTGMGTINPERRDEALNRSLANFRSQAEAQARNEAMQELVNAAKVTGQIAAPVTQVGSTTTRGREVASANAGAVQDVNRKNNYLALASQVLGPLLKGVDLSKLVGGVQSANEAASPTLYGPGRTGSLDWGASQGGGVPMPPTGSPGFSPVGGIPSAGGEIPSWADASFDPGAWQDYMGTTYNQPNMTMEDFQGTGMPELPQVDPGGYNFDFNAAPAPQFNATDFNPSWDFSPYGSDAGGFDAWDFGAGNWT